MVSGAASGKGDLCCGQRGFCHCCRRNHCAREGTGGTGNAVEEPEEVATVVIAVVDVTQAPNDAIDGVCG